MSASGIQLKAEPQVTYWHPTIQQYLHGIREAVMTNNLPAAEQAYARLVKAVPAGGSSAIASRVEEVGKALGSGDLAAAEQALGAVRQELQSAASAKVAAEPVATTAQEGGDSKLNLRV